MIPIFNNFMIKQIGVFDFHSWGSVGAPNGTFRSSVAAIRRPTPRPGRFPCRNLVICRCGGGGQADVQPPPPPSPDFALALSASTVTVAQGSTSSPVNVSITQLNGFSGQVQVSLGMLPTGIVANPLSPFTVNAGASVPSLFTASDTAATGTINLTATGTSGSITRTV